jgi:hypothetical protein
LNSSRKIFTYLQTSEQERSNLPWIQKSIIIQVLKEKHLENFNWFSFSIGYLLSKVSMFKEDLELAIDVTKRRIDSRDLPKSEIGSKGWFKIGQEAKEKVEEYIKASQELSNRQERKLRKKGETLEDDKKLIQLVATEEDLKLYFLPAMGGNTEHGLPEDENEIKARKRVLCSYGKGTQWCTAVPDGDWHENYLGNNIYIIHEKDKPIYQFVNCLDEGEENHQFMDSDDNIVSELDMKYYDFLKKYANGASHCYDIKPKFTVSIFLNNSLDDNLKRQISGKNLAEILNGALNITSRDDFFKITSIIKNLDISLDNHNIFDFIWNISPLHVKNPVVKNLIDGNKDKLVAGQVHDLIANSPPTAKSETLFHKTRLWTDDMIEVLGEKNLMKLNSTYIIGIIQDSVNRKEMTRLLGAGVINKLKSSPSDIINWIVHSSDVKETIDIVGLDSIKVLLPSEVDVIFTSKYLQARNSQEDMEYLVKKFIETDRSFNMSSVSAILLNTNTAKDDYIERMIKILGKKNVSKLWYESIHKLFDEIFAKKGFRGQEELAKLLKEYYIHPELSGENQSDARMANWAKIENLINKHLD